ncbi:toll-like receptor 1, partial [Alosa alosa]|uniref:toll-like receptor 1 n=1 Tax=Alosa alosa TaxID=278164 RepID=UPI0020154DBA
MDVSLWSSLLLSFLLIASVWMKEAAGTCIMPDKDRIDLSDQNLTSMPSNLPRNTQDLDLSFNTISTLTSTDLASLSALCIFKMSNCGLISISPAAFQGNLHLQELDLSFNMLSAIPEIQGLPKLRIFDLSENLYESFALGQSFQHLQSLSSLSLGGRQVSRMNKFDLKPLTRSPLRELALQAGNDLTHFNTDFLETLDLSFNPIELPDHTKVIWPSHLKNLSLSGNLLGNHLFDHLSPHFVSLNLTHTDITSVNTDALQPMKDLKQLHMGSNAIRELPPDLMLPALEELHVDRNSISTFKLETFRGLPKLEKLNGANNPFVCDCNLYWFVRDFNKTLLVDWPAAYNCYSPTHLSGTLLKDFHPSQVACDPLSMFAICFTVVLLVLISCGIVFHFMDGAWYVKMLWIWLRVKQRSRNKDRRLESSTFNYHAFISYSVKDAQWVQSELAPHLEASNFQLCLHERDFVPGEWVIDNIINCVESSYKTVFILSQSFVHSEWCNYELFFAQHRAIGVQRDSLVLILLEPIPPDSLSRKFLRLRSLLRQQTYLPWPQEEPKRQLFWASLTAMLRTGDKTVVADKSAVLQQVAGDIADLVSVLAD